MYSKSCKYGVRAVLYLALHSDEENKLGAKELAESIVIPYHFLAKILQELARKGIISSTKGPRGGFFLTEINKSKNLLSVVDTIDGSAWYEECAFGLKQCDADHPCPVHHAFQPLKDTLYRDLKNQTIEAFANKLKAGDIFVDTR